VKQFLFKSNVACLAVPSSLQRKGARILRSWVGRNFFFALFKSQSQMYKNNRQTRPKTTPAESSLRFVTNHRGETSPTHGVTDPLLESVDTIDTDPLLPLAQASRLHPATTSSNQKLHSTPPLVGVAAAKPAHRVNKPPTRTTKTNQVTLLFDIDI
jgi:hypothetical protein